MIRTFALVPIRGLASGKSRLAGQFSPDQRRQLTAALAAHVVNILAASDQVDEIVVVSQDLTELFGLLSAYPDTVVLEQPDHVIGLNGALDLGRTWARMRGADRIAVVSADLPRLTIDDVRSLLAGSSAVTIAPDDAGTGTNALVLRNTPTVPTVDRFTLAFEGMSRAAHEREAHRIGASVDIVSTPGLATDLDMPRDWRMLPATTRSALIDWRMADAHALSGVE